MPTPYNPPLLPLSPDDTPSYRFDSWKAVAILSKLSGMMEASPKAELFWITWLMKEARYSNVIEGTVTTYDEIFGDQAGVLIPVERRNDVKEVINYHDAMICGLDEIKNKKPLNLFMIKSLHALLLNGARGESKRPGQWRNIQVHIGPDKNIEHATYIPPPPEHVVELLENLIKFMDRDDIDPIIQIAIIHAQFEMIHPFSDGNGRMGRLLITIFLAYKKIISNPCFYMSVYLQNNRDVYYEKLKGVSQKNNWNDWIQFFINGVIQQSNENINILRNMIDLYEKSKERFVNATGSANAIQILDYVFQKPIFTIPSLVQKSNISLSRQGYIRIINKLEENNLIQKIQFGEKRKPIVWQFTELISILS